MGVWQTMKENVRDRLRSFLEIQPPIIRSYHVWGDFDFAGNALKNRIWYRGQASELEEFWKQVPGDANRRRFWCAVPIVGRDIEKIHVGLPALMVDTLTNIVVSDLQQMQLDSMALQDKWDEIAEENGFYDLVSEAVRECLVVGDGAFRVSLLPRLSKLPVIEFISGERVEYKFDRGRLVEIEFLTDMGEGCTLVETYGNGYIETHVEKEGQDVPLESFGELEDVEPRIEWDGDFMLAIPLRFFPSKMWPHRGGSIFDTRSDCFDALDECWSQWMDALRKGRTKEYVPESLMPRDPRNGALIMPTAFDNAYIRVEGSYAEGAHDKIEVVQPEIRHESYMQTYINALDLCLQGVLSPSTLGVDVKKLDNAEAQREKEKVTLYTRAQIVTKLQQVLPKLVKTCVLAWQTSEMQSLQEPDVSAVFGEYANPSFESVVETVGKAKVQGIMSLEACVEELYGDTRDEVWKAEEVARLKSEQGMVAVDEPLVGVSWEDVIGYGQGGGEPLPDAAAELG